MLLLETLITVCYDGMNDTTAQQGKMTPPPLTARRAALAAALALLAALPAHAAMMALDSATDGNGVFTYTLSRGADAYLFGGKAEVLSLLLPTHGLQEVTTPQGWCADTAMPNVVRWRWTNAGACVVAAEPLTFAVRSMYVLSASYTDTAALAVYPMATVFGEVYRTNRTRYIGCPAGGVVPANVVGFERSGFTGPIVPEPMLAGCVLALICLVRSRMRRGATAVLAASVLAAVASHAGAGTAASGAIAVSYPDSAARYGLYEVTIAHDERPYTNVWDDAAVAASFSPPAGAPITVDGYYYTTDTWKVRFAPAQAGAYAWSLQLGADAVTGGFISVEAGETGFLRVSQTNCYRFIREADGSLFNMHGWCSCWYFDPDGPLDQWEYSSWPLDTVPNVGIDAYLDAMAGRTRLNMYRWSVNNCSPDMWTTISPSGNVYNWKAQYFGDLLVQELRARGVRVWLDMFGWKPPYLSPAEYAVTANANAVKRYIRYMVARYAACVDVWELANETANIDSGWISLFGGYLKSIDPYHHPVTISWEQPDHPVIDVSAPHWYSSGGGLWNNDNWDIETTNNINFSTGVDGGTRYRKSEHPKPVVFGEAGNMNSSWDSQSDYRNRIKAWTAFFNEGAFMWWEMNWKSNYYGPPAGLYFAPAIRQYFGALQDWSSDIDADARITNTVAVAPPAGVTMRWYELRSPRSVYLYLRDVNSWNGGGNVSGAQVTVAPSQPGMAYWFNTWNGTLIQSTPVVAGSQTLTAPVFRLDVALKIVGDRGPLAIATKPLAGAVAGKAYIRWLAASGGILPYEWSIASGALPDGLALDASSGCVSGTPSSTGAFSFVVRAVDAAVPAATDTCAFTIAVEPPPPLGIITAWLPSGTAGQPYSGTLAASGGVPPRQWRISSGALPAGLGLVAASGAITGTPVAEGVCTFTAEVSDARVPPVTATRELDIAVNPPLPLAITTVSLPDGTVGQAYNRQLGATGGVLPYSWQIDSGSLPAGLGLTPAGAITGTPAGAVNSSFVVGVSDSRAVTATKGLSLRISAMPSGTILICDFTGTAPGTSTPWTNTTYLAPGVAYSGWRRGAGAFGASNVSNALGFYVEAGAEDSTLDDAIAANAHLFITLEAAAGGLSLAGKRVAFTIRRYDYFAPREYSVMTSVGGFTAGQELLITPVLGNEDTAPHSYSLVLPEEGFASVTGVFQLRIYAHRARYSSHRTSMSAFSIVDTPPAAPSNLVATALDAHQIGLTWSDASGNETGFSIERSMSGNGGWSVVATPEAGASSWNDAGLPPETLHYYRVQAVNDTGTGGYSNVASAMTLEETAFMARIQCEGGNVAVSFATEAGRTYRLMRNASTPDLDDEGWAYTGDAVTGDGGSNAFIVPLDDALGGFYRVEDCPGP